MAVTIDIYSHSFGGQKFQIRVLILQIPVKTLFLPCTQLPSYHVVRPPDLVSVCICGERALSLLLFA